MSARRSLATATTTALAISAGPAAFAMIPPKSYRNCTALQRDYPHGVARQGAHDKTSDTPVTTFKVAPRVYARNDGRSLRYPGEYDLDRDNDGIACEKR